MYCGAATEDRRQDDKKVLMLVLVLLFPTTEKKIPKWDVEVSRDRTTLLLVSVCMYRYTEVELVDYCLWSTWNLEHNSNSIVALTSSASSTARF